MHVRGGWLGCWDAWRLHWGTNHDRPSFNEWIHTHAQNHMTLYKLHETLHDIHTYMHGQLYPKMHCLMITCTASSRIIVMHAHVWLVWDGMMHRDFTGTDHDRPSLSGHTHVERRTHNHIMTSHNMYKLHMRHNI